MNFEYDSSNSRTICSTPLLTPVIIDGRLHHVPSPLSTTPFFSSSSKFSQFTITPNKNVQFTPLKPPSPPLKSKSNANPTANLNSNQQTPLTSAPPPLLPDPFPKFPPGSFFICFAFLFLSPLFLSPFSFLLSLPSFLPSFLSLCRLPYSSPPFSSFLPLLSFLLSFPSLPFSSLLFLFSRPLALAPQFSPPLTHIFSFFCIISP